MIGYHRFHVLKQMDQKASRVASCILGNCWAPPRCFEICFVSRAPSFFRAWPWWIQIHIKDVASSIFQQHLQTGEACEIYSSIPHSWLKWSCPQNSWQTSLQNHSLHLHDSSICAKNCFDGKNNFPALLTNESPFKQLECGNVKYWRCQCLQL